MCFPHFTDGDLEASGALEALPRAPGHLGSGGRVTHRSPSSPVPRLSDAL